MVAENIEETNAARWEVESEVSVAPSIPRPGLNVRNPSVGATHIATVLPQNAAASVPRLSPTRVVPQGNLPYRQAHAVAGTSQPGRVNEGPSNAAQHLHNFSRGRPNVHNEPNRAGGHAPRDAKRPQNAPASGQKKNGNWASKMLLLTTFAERKLRKEEQEKQMRDMYLEPLEENADPFAVGYYIWTLGVSPGQLLGYNNLEKLDNTRIQKRVWIELHKSGGMECLKVSSRSEATHDRDVREAIDSIRQQIQSTKANAIMASPLYLAVAPSPENIRSIVQATIDEPQKVTGLELTGAMLSEEEMTVWKEKRVDIATQGWKKFEDHLVKHMLALAADKGWMRLRIHFGHFEFSMVHKSLHKGELSFMDFHKMMNNPRITGKLNRQLPDAAIATSMKKRVLDWATRFTPVVGSNLEDLAEVKFKDSEVIFVTCPSGRLRLEADIDRIKDDTTYTYQIGTSRYFHDNRTNRRMQINVIDVEKRVDWAVEVISDNTLETGLPKELADLIDNSVNIKTGVRKDPLGLSYPDVRPLSRSNQVEINCVVVRSVIQYTIRESGYIVEIVIYRTWDGNLTHREPKMESSVSMYHPLWDEATSQVKGTNRERGWDTKLSQFFDMDRVRLGTSGIEALVEEVKVVQDLLGSAQEENRMGKKKASD